MRRLFDLNLDRSIDLQSTPPLSPKLAMVLAGGLVALLCWFGLDAKQKEDAANAARKAAKKQAIATVQK